jgi:hypothetical protein
MPRNLPNWCSGKSPATHPDLGYGILHTNRWRATLPCPHQTLVRVNPADQREITGDSDQYLSNHDAIQHDGERQA